MSDATPAALAIETEDKAALMDSLILCKFLRGVFADFFAEAAEMLELVTGWRARRTKSYADRAADRHGQEAFNILAGWQPAEDTLPERFLSDPLPEDATATLTPERLAALGGGLQRAAGGRRGLDTGHGI